MDVRVHDAASSHRSVTARLLLIAAVVVLGSVGVAHADVGRTGAPPAQGTELGGRTSTGLANALRAAIEAHATSAPADLSTSTNPLANEPTPAATSSTPATSDEGDLPATEALPQPSDNPLTADTESTATAGLPPVAAAVTPDPSQPRTDAVYVSPTGAGRECTMDNPCGSIGTALAVVAPRTTILMFPGQYGGETIGGSRYRSESRVTVAPLTSEPVTMGLIQLSQPNITLQGLSFSGGISLRRGSDGTVLENAHVFGSDATVIIRANNVVVRRSLIEGGHAQDGIQIAGHPTPNSGVLIENNVVRDFTSAGNHAEHPDCIQLWDTQNVTIRQNQLSNCFNSGITFSPGARKGITNVVVEANWISGCLMSRQACGNGGSAMDLRTAVSGVTVTQNTFGVGSVRLPYQEGVSAPNNIVGYLSVANPCTTSFQNSLVADYPRWACKNGPPGADRGNVLGSASVADRNGGDLLLTQPSPTLGSATARATPTADIFGNILLDSTVGAEQR